MEKLGDGYFRYSDEYVVRGRDVIRADGSYVKFIDEFEAHAAAQRLDEGEDEDTEYEWHEDD